MTATWLMPGGGFHLQIDALAAFFLLPVFGLSLVTAVYGRSYLAGRGDGSGLAGCWFHSNLLTAGMASVIAAHDGLLFLVSWEIMALSPFFLVIFQAIGPLVHIPVVTDIMAALHNLSQQIRV